MPAFAESFGAPRVGRRAALRLGRRRARSAASPTARAHWTRPLRAVYLRIAALLPLGFLPALLAPSVAAMALLIIPAGLLIAPLGAAGNQLVGTVAPAGAVTEAYTWPTTR